MKKMFALLLCAFIFSLVSTVYAEGNTIWSLENGVLTISGNGEMENYRAWEAPWYGTYSEITTAVIQKGVTTIGSEAFTCCKNLRTVSLPDSLVAISDHAFYYTGITEIQIPDSVTSIGYSAFNGCISLETINIPSGVTVIDEYTFVDCYSLNSIDLPNGITSIGQAAFVNSGLNSITIPATVTSVAWRAFDHCDSLTDVWYGGSREQWNALTKNIADGNDALLNAEVHTLSLPSGTCGDGVRWLLDNNGTLTISGNGTMSSYTDITDTPWYSYASKIKKVVLESGVTTVGSYSFYSLTALEHIELADSVTEIGERAFANCSSLVQMHFGSGLTTIRDYAFYNINRSLKSLTIPASVQYIGRYAFAFITGIRSICIPESVITIGEGAFANCSALRALYIPASVKSIEGMLISSQSTVLFTNAASDNSGWATKWNCYNSYTQANTIFNSDVEEFWFWAELDETSRIVKIPAYISYVFPQAFSKFSNLRYVFLSGQVQKVYGMYEDYAPFNNGRYRIRIYTDAAQQQYGWGTYWNGGCSSYYYNTSEELFDHIATEIHSFENYVSDRNATCQKNGTKTAICSFDGCTEASQIEDLGSQLSHTIAVDGAVAATCTQTGLTEGSHCSVCSTILTPQEIISTKDHTVEIDDAVDATCQTPGLTEGSHCSECGMVLLKQEATPMIAHSYRFEDRIAPSCTLPGREESYSCQSCGDTLVGGAEIPAAGHQEQTVEAIAPTCTATGTASGVICSVCGEVLSGFEEVEATGHHYKIISAVEPTCNDAGNSRGLVCTECSYAMVPCEVIPALGHEYDHGLCIRCGKISKTMNVLSLPEKLVTISESAFENINAEIIVIPETVQTIQAHAFTNNDKLQAVIFLGNPVSIADDILDNCPDCIIAVHANTTAEQWAQRKNFTVKYLDTFL